jgi:excisionase family DNA binding protein
MPQNITDTGRRAHSIAETCALTGLGRDTVYTAIRDGRLVARKLGRRTLITDDDLRQFLAGLPRAGGRERTKEIPSKTKAATEAAREVKSGVVT